MSFMVLGHPNFTCNLAGITIDDKLTFTPYQWSIIKKANQTFPALNNKMLYLGFEKNTLMSPFIKSHYSCYLLEWIFCSRNFIILIVFTKNDCLVANESDSTFNELLESYNKLSHHKTCIKYLMIKVFNYLHGLSAELMTDIFTICKNPNNICNICLFASKNPVNEFQSKCKK